MTQKQYRTAQGKIVDLGALQLQNENTRAVGNMPVNARGDLIDSHNRPIDTRNQQVARQYRKQVSNVQDAPVYSSRQRTTPPAAATPAPQPVAAQPVTEQPAAEAPGGLAGAIARARSVKQEPITPTGKTTGFKKI
jgi:phage protein D